MKKCGKYGQMCKRHGKQINFVYPQLSTILLITKYPSSTTRQTDVNIPASYSRVFESFDFLMFANLSSVHTVGEWEGSFGEVFLGEFFVTFVKIIFLCEEGKFVVLVSVEDVR